MRQVQELLKHHIVPAILDHDEMSRGKHQGTKTNKKYYQINEFIIFVTEPNRKSRNVRRNARPTCRPEMSGQPARPFLQTIQIFRLGRDLHRANVQTIDVLHLYDFAE